MRSRDFLETFSRLSRDDLETISGKSRESLEKVSRKSRESLEIIISRDFFRIKTYSHHHYCPVPLSAPSTT
jgi:hypothetical protein